MTARPVRLRLSRAKGFSLQALSIAINGLAAVNCARPGAFGNPFYVGGYHKIGKRNSVGFIRLTALRAEYADASYRHITTNAEAVAMFEEYIAEFGPPTGISDLRGKNLACRCKLCARHAATGKPLDEDCPDCAPCHTDVLGRLANGFTCEAVT